MAHCAANGGLDSIGGATVVILMIKAYGPFGKVRIERAWDAVTHEFRVDANFAARCEHPDTLRCALGALML